jgi:hypothetical protein
MGIYIVLENLTTHKTPQTKRWLKLLPLFTPTYNSAGLTTKQGR